jgi:putative tryptophan/tyrosine transport system substrate-binding protein
MLVCKRRFEVEMLRRKFVAGIGLSIVLPRTAVAQVSKLPVVGYLGAYSESIQQQWTNAFVQRLRELGWTENRNIVLEYRWADGRAERFVEIANEFARLNVSVIVTGGTAPILAAKNATSTIPIIFATAADPIGTGIVTSLSKPGGNVTGLSLQWTDLANKRLELLREAVPGLQRLAIMANATAAGAILEMNEVGTTARTLGIAPVPLEFRKREDIAPGIAELRGRAEALFVCGDPLANTNRALINSAALDAKIPTMYASREYAEAGGFISYGASFSDLYRRAGDYVDKVLRGARAGDIPVEQPTKFEFVINLKTARALGLDLSPSFLARADEVIE